MRAFVVTGPRRFSVEDVEPPVAAAGQVVVDVERAGVCGTDVEFFTGEMAYLHQGHAEYPMRLGHEWCGTVSAVGDGVDEAWIGRRATGDTMLGCGRCRRCLNGLQHVCEDRFEIGIRGGWPGALAERLVVPATALHALPDTVDATAGALVEPGGNALRAVRGRRWRREPGCWCSDRARSACSPPGSPSPTARRSTSWACPSDPWTSPARSGCTAPGPRTGFPAAVRRRHRRLQRPRSAGAGPRPGGAGKTGGLHRPRGRPQRRRHPHDGAQGRHGRRGPERLPGLAGTIEHYASGSVDPRPLVAATVGLDEVGEVLAGSRPAGSGPGPKIHVDPRI